MEQKNTTEMKRKKEVKTDDANVCQTDKFLVSVALKFLKHNRVYNKWKILFYSIENLRAFLLLMTKKFI